MCLDTKKIAEFEDTVKEFAEKIPPQTPTIGIVDMLYGNENDNSNILKHLLDKYGSHECGEGFLNEFLKILKIDDIEASDFEDIEREQQTAAGRRIDLVIDFKNAIIGIECKIGAPDQPKQLDDYYKHLKSVVGKRAVYLIYLTLNVKDSGTLKKYREKLGNNYIKISWSKDIINWLDKCLKIIEKKQETVELNNKRINYETVRSEIYLYIEYIKILTNQNERSKIMNEKMLEILTAADGGKLKEISEYKNTLSDFSIRFFQVKECLEKDRKINGIKYWTINTELSTATLIEGSVICTGFNTVISIPSQYNSGIYYGFVELNNGDQQVIKIKDNSYNPDDVVNNLYKKSIEYIVNLILTKAEFPT